MKKGYKPTKKFVKAAGQDVVSVGFPDNALLRDRNSWNTSDDGDRLKVVILEEEINKEKFLEWKASLPAYEKKGAEKVTATSGILEEKLRGFDLSNATPMECMMFLASMKTLINN